MQRRTMYTVSQKNLFSNMPSPSFLLLILKDFFQNFLQAVFFELE